MGFLDFARGVGNFFNSAFNTVKNGFRGVSGTVKNVANAVSSGLKLFHFIPGVSAISGVVDGIAQGINTGVDIGNSVFDFGESVQQRLGLPTRNGVAVQA
jgi:phage-related protein